MRFGSNSLTHSNFLHIGTVFPNLLGRFPLANKTRQTVVCESQTRKAIMNEHAVDHEPDPNDDEPLTPLKILGKAVVDTVFLTLISGFLIFNLAYQIGGQEWTDETWIYVGLLPIVLLKFFLRGLKYVRLFQQAINR